MKKEHVPKSGAGGKKWRSTLRKKKEKAYYNK